VCAGLHPVHADCINPERTVTGDKGFCQAVL